MSKIKHAFVVPLIGGQALGQADALGSPPLFMQSFSAFAKNDQHIRAWWPKVPFQVLDEEDSIPVAEPVDVVGMTPPCAGLSSLSPTSHADSAVNDWMYRASEHVLKNLAPRVAWGENAPALSSDKGRPVALKLREIGRRYGYTFSLYRTKSALHGNPQVRQRTFYFFWKEKDQVPALPWIDKGFTPIEEFLSRSKESQDPNSEIFTHEEQPSSMPIYRYILHRLGVDHATFIREKIDKTTIMSQFLMSSGWIDDAIRHLTELGHERDARRVSFWKKKLGMKMGIMDRYLILPKGNIGAFIGQLTYALAHPVEDRFLSIREMEDLMGMPQNFTLINPRRNIHHLTQNVPVGTARDMGLMIKDYLAGKLSMVPITDELPIFDNMRRQMVGLVTKKERYFF